MRPDLCVMFGAPPRGQMRSDSRRLVLFRKSRQKRVQTPGFFKVLADLIFLEHENDLLPLPPASPFIELFGLSAVLSALVAI